MIMKTVIVPYFRPTMENKTTTHPMTFSVPFDYPVTFCRGVFEEGSEVLLDILNRRGDDRVHRCLVVVDEEVAASHPELAHQIQQWFKANRDEVDLVKDPISVTGGEPIKNDYRKLMELVDVMLEYKLCRQSFVIVIGGGAVIDAVGLATSLVHRGLRLVRMPTTTLAQNDAGVGVKNAMNLHGGKNTIGTFAPPWAVINDYNFLATLADEHYLGGISEAFKVAIIKDKVFFERLCVDAPKYKARDQEAMAFMIRRCAELHLEHIATNGDPFEMGTARPLDFGHWAAHKLEGMTNYKVSHGYAVGMGVALDSYYAMRKGWLTETEFDAIVGGLEQSGLPLWFEAMDRRLGDGELEIIGGLADFQEHLGGELTVTFPDGIGKKQEKHEIDTSIVEDGIAFLCERHQANVA